MKDGWFLCWVGARDRTRSPHGDGVFLGGGVVAVRREEGSTFTKPGGQTGDDKWGYVSLFFGFCSGRGVFLWCAKEQQYTGCPISLF